MTPETPESNGFTVHKLVTLDPPTEHPKWCDRVGCGRYSMTGYDFVTTVHVRAGTLLTLKEVTQSDGTRIHTVFATRGAGFIVDAPGSFARWIAWITNAFKEIRYAQEWMSKRANETYGGTL